MRKLCENKQIWKLSPVKINVLFSLEKNDALKISPHLQKTIIFMISQLWSKNFDQVGAKRVNRNFRKSLINVKAILVLIEKHNQEKVAKDNRKNN